MMVYQVCMAVFSTALLRWFYQIFLDEKKNRIVKFGYGLYAIWQIIAWLDIPTGIRGSISLLAIFLFAFLFGGTIKERIFVAVLNGIFCLLCEAFVGSVCLAVLPPDYRHEMLLCDFFSKVLMFLIILYLRKSFGIIRNNFLTWKTSLVVAVFPMGSIFIAYNYFQMYERLSDKNNNGAITAVFVILLLLNLSVIFIYQKMASFYALKRQQSVMELQLDLISKHNYEQEQSIKQIRKMKHDLKNHMLYAKNLLQLKQYSELEEYYENNYVIDEWNELFLVQSGNSLVDSLVNYKYQLAKKNGIMFKAKVNIPTHMSYNTPELCIILGNALDNAIEANLDKKIDNSFVELVIKYEKENLYIQIKNSYDGVLIKDEKHRIISRKENNLNHGIGIASIRNSLVRFHGDYDVICEEKIYRLNMILYPEG